MACVKNQKQRLFAPERSSSAFKAVIFYIVYLFYLQYADELIFYAAVFSRTLYLIGARFPPCLPVRNSI